MSNNRPFYRSAKDAWYCWVNGKQKSLGVRGAKAIKQAHQAWLNLDLTSPTAPQLLLKSTIEAFLIDAETRLKANTTTLYRADLNRLFASFGDTPVATITHQMITIWLNKTSGSSTTKAIRIRSVSAFFGWCVKQDLLMVNPAIKVVKPKSRSRSVEAIISDSDHARLLVVASPEFRLVLRVMHATGCRPSEACAFAVDNFDAVNGVVRLEVHKSDRIGKPRLIYLTPELIDILRVQVARYGSGALLRTPKGIQWRSKQITETMTRLRRRLQITAIAYGYRHSFATRALSKGVPDAHVAALLGHSSTATLHKHYSHLTSQAEVLRAALARV